MSGELVRERRHYHFSLRHQVSRLVPEPSGVSNRIPMFILLHCKNILRLVLPPIILMLSSTLAPAQDLAREQRMADEIVDSILDGEPVRLNTAGTKFLAIYTESQTEVPKGTVVLMHGRGFHSDWPEMVGPLRVGLAEAGWHTLSIQMPVLGKGSTYYDTWRCFP